MGSYQAKFFFLLCWLWPAVSTAGGEASLPVSEPFYSRNQNPFVQIFGLPAAEPGTVARTGDWSGRLVVSAANSSNDAAAGNERILLDGETYRAVAVFRHGVTPEVECGIDLPYVAHNRGVFDYFIDDWHGFFNLPEGQRPGRERQLLEYSYAEDGRPRLHLDRATGGLGDIALTGGFQLFSHPAVGRAAALRVMLKLPTGRSESLHGSGAPDLGVSLFGHDRGRAGGRELHFFGGGGLLLTGKGEILAERQRPVIGFASAGAGWVCRDWLDLKVQFDGHTPFYDSGLRELGQGSVQVNIGGALHPTTRSSLTFNVAEDIVVDTAPDVVFYIELRTVF